MNFNVTKEGVDKKYTEKMNNLFREKGYLKDVGKYVPSMTTLNERDGEKGKYGVVVKSVDLSINHTEILENGMKLLIDEGVQLPQPIEYFDEYGNWVDSFNTSVESKGEIQKSSEILSPVIQKQLEEGWFRHLESMVYPNRKPVSSGMDIMDYLSEISSSIDS